VVYLCFFLA